MKDVIIDIKGTQLINGQTDKIELTTVGKMNRIGRKTYLKYDDSASSGVNGVTCLIKVDPDDKSVMMKRSGALNSNMFIKSGQRHICHYQTPHGTITMGIFGEAVEGCLSESGGSLCMRYTIDVNYGMLSQNKVEIKVKET